MGDSWSIPFKSFDADVLTSSTNGSVCDLDDVRADHAVQYTLVTTAGTDAAVALQGSLDGTNWIDGIAAGFPLGGPTTVTALQVNTSLKPVRYLRAVATVNSGSLTITAILTSRA